MTVEPSYTENELRRVGAEYNLSGYLDRVIRRSTPDTRLQAIADAWKNYLTSRDVGTPDQEAEGQRLLFWLLDALTEEVDDG